MTAQIKIEVNLVVKESFKVGANPQPPNQFDLSITNNGDPLQLTPKKCFYLTGSLGSGKEALFLNEEDAQQCSKSSPKDWSVVWDFYRKEEGIFRLKIYSFKKFNTGDSFTITFENVISKTDPDGPAALSFETDFSDAKQALSIPKTPDKPGIISFYAIPAESAENLPGTKVTLKWRTFKLTRRALFRADRTDPLPCNFEQDEGFKDIKVSDTDTTYRLEGYAENLPISRKLQIKALRPGWHEAINTVFEGDPAYPIPETETDTEALEEDEGDEGIDLEPTLLFNADDVNLYGIFRREFEGKREAFLFKTENPFVGWSFVTSSVPDQTGLIPEGFADSPGVYCDGKLWLVGGSQIDPDRTSNIVWYFDLKKGVWENLGAADWTPRMGHAVQVFYEDQKAKIWVLGGRDEDGKALNDVWTLDVLDVQKPSWDPLPKPPPQKIWDPRCLFNTAVYDQKLWLYGGAKEPFSAELYDDLYVYSGGSWQKREMTGIIQGSESRKPIASSLQVFKGELCLFGKFRTINPDDKSEIVEPLAFSLASATTKSWEPFPSEGLKGWGSGDSTFSYQLVNFRDKMLIARALGYNDPNPVLKVYVSW